MSCQDMERANAEMNERLLRVTSVAEEPGCNGLSKKEEAGYLHTCMQLSVSSSLGNISVPAQAQQLQQLLLFRLPSVSVEIPNGGINPVKAL